MKELQAWPQTNRPSPYGFERCEPNRIYMLEKGRDFTTNPTAVVKAVKRFAAANDFDAETRVDKAYGRDGRPGEVKAVAFRFTNRRAEARPVVSPAVQDPVA